MNVRPVELDDAEGIVEIYNYYILTSHATFEVEPIDSDEMRRRISTDLDQGYPFVVAVSDALVLGYSHGHDYRPRRAYANTVEISVYVRPGFEGQGIGREIYGVLFDEVRASGFHAVVAGISLPNDASVRLHESLGMRKVAHFREVGRKFDRWIDVAYWEITL